MPPFSISQAFYFLKGELAGIYDSREATAIAHEVMEHLSGMPKIDRLINKDHLLDTTQETKLYSFLRKLQAQTPIQYVLGRAWFMESPYFVNEDVLIPRPETEELVYWIVQDHKEKKPLKVLDIGTGSGCIPISLKKQLSEAEVYACDISQGALSVAERNTRDLNTEVHYFMYDILQQPFPAPIPEGMDIIVSNPPYIPRKEYDDMSVHVREKEPVTALFVPDEDPLIFYKAIARFGSGHLQSEGSVYCEIHQDFGEDTVKVFRQAGYVSVELRKDIHNNYRMLKAKR